MFRKFFFVLLPGAFLLVLVLLALGLGHYHLQSSRNFDLLGQAAPALEVGGHRYRDLNKNGELDPYEDSRLDVDDRVEDLLVRMNVAEKAGTMFITQIASRNGGSLVERPTTNDIFSLKGEINSDLIARKLMNSFNIVFTGSPAELAAWHNNIQKLAERTRLGIPVTIASDPRHGFGSNPAASLPAEHFSLWPEPLGLAATRDIRLVEEFGRYANAEYRAVGIRLALHPMADLATEPRWARAAGTFGEDAHLSAEMTKAYVLGFQGAQLGDESVATMVKHFSGGGPQADGKDAHFPHGKGQIYPGDNFDYHLIPFTEGAFPAGAAQVMPYYGIPVGQTSEEVGFAFNRDIITGLLREEHGFEGVVCADWGLLTDAKMLGTIVVKRASAWGVEDLSVDERMLKLLDAGIDQFGGESIPEVLVSLVELGRVTEHRLDVSVRRILLDKFRLGLFDDPYVDASIADEIVGNRKARNAGEVAQRKSLVLLKNDGGSFLPLDRDGLAGTKIYLENLSPDLITPFAEVVDDPSQADLAILRIAAPFYPRSGIMESQFHSGDLDFKGEEKARILNILKTVPTVVDIYLDRAAVIPEIVQESAAVVANFGSTDEVLVELLLGEFEPTGKLPLELPRSMSAVEEQFEDVPYDSQDPIYPYGHGLGYQ